MIPPEHHEFVEYAYARKKRIVDHLWQLLQIAGIAAVTAFCTFAYTMNRVVPISADIASKHYVDGYMAGYTAGLKATDWKTKAVADPAFTRPLCNAWWFGLSVRDRSLK